MDEYEIALRHAHERLKADLADLRNSAKIGDKEVIVSREAWDLLFVTRWPVEKAKEEE